MENHTQWTQEAANNLSSGFTRNESISMLVENGLHPSTAIAEVDKQVKQSWRKGFKEMGWSFLALLLLVFFVGISLLSIAAGILILGAGLKRIGTLLLVTKPFKKYST